MGFRKVTYVLAVCDVCGPDWWTSTADSAPLFDSQAAARAELAAGYGWRIERQLSGRVRMFCPSCAVRSDCELYGHDWPEVGDGRLACCLRCSRVRRDEAPPAAHPDAAVTGGLPGWLADLEVALFGPAAAAAITQSANSTSTQRSIEGEETP
jgi:hypothetical protein